MTERWQGVAFWASVLVFAGLVFLLGVLVGAGRGLELMRQQAVDEGYAVREEDGSFRWRSSEELERRPRRRGE